MSLVLLLIRLHFFVSSCDAIPLTITQGSDIPLANTCPGIVLQSNINSQRSTLDILWSCLATTFAVTWLSVHPNIPSPGEKVWWVTWRRFKIMFWALVAPEFVVLWAWRQRRAACKIAEEVRILAKKRKQTYGHDWTITHGHFLQMGGFFIQLDKRSPRVLYFEQFKSMVGKTIDIPSISADEINDKGKNDPLGKGVATLQVIWFIVQVISRLIVHLAITQLELTTAALACLNATMYILWWSKPLDVRCPFIIQPYPLPLKLVDQSIYKPDSTCRQEESTPAELKDSESTSPNPTQQEAEDTIKQKVYRYMMTFISSAAEPFLDIARTLSVNIRNAFTNGMIAGLKNCLFGWLISPFIHLVVGIVIERQITPGDRIPIFYVWPGDKTPNGGQYSTKTSIMEPNLFGIQFSNPSSVSLDTIFMSIEALHSQLSTTVTTRWKELFMASLMGGFFGGIHALGWNLQFPSIIERDIWRMSACTVTAIPCFYILFRLLFDRGRWLPAMDLKFYPMVMYFIIAISYCAVITRIFLFIGSLLALRALPPSAFATLDWLSLIPHI